MDNLKNRWKMFAGVVFDPWTIFLLITVSILFFLSANEQNRFAASLLFVLITISSAILGGRVTKHWVDITEGGIVRARGKSAVRSLKLLLRNIASLETRIRNFRFAEDEIENHPEVIKRNYEEVVETCSLLQEETINSIENWTDIVPEADIKTQIGVISDLKSNISEKENELSLLNEKFNAAKGETEQSKKNLKEKILEKENQIKKLEREVMDKKIGIGGLGLLSIPTANLDALSSSHIDPSPYRGSLLGGLLDTSYSSTIREHLKRPPPKKPDRD